jgi:acyl-CoA synthetase (AMP-forming)/AMP-acid ligase II
MSGGLRGVLIHDLQDAVMRHAGAGRTAIIDTRGTVSYAAFARMVDYYAGGVRERINGRRGTLVGVLAARTATAAAAFIGAMQAGACSSFVEPRLAADILAVRMSAVGMRHLIVDHEDLELRNLLSSSGIYVHSVNDLSGRAFRDEHLQPDDEAMILFTSGSTGEPKAAVLSHSNLLCNAEGIIRHTDITPEDRLLHVMPLHHTNGINNQLIAPLLAGATVVLIEKFKAERFIDQVRTFAPTYVTGVPTMYLRALPHVPACERFRSLRFLRCGSAPIQQTLHEQIEESFGVRLSVSYGLSEATCTSTMNPAEARKIGTVGTVLCGQRVKLFSPGTSKEVMAQAEGEVCIAGPAVMKGYIPAGKENPIIDGWLRTGDLGRFDEQGYLTITGRIKDVIIRGGETLSPQQIEAVLNSHPAVAASCVVAQPEAELGEVPVAFVVSRYPQAISEHTLQNWVSVRLSRTYVPARVEFMQSLPENSTGKVDRGALKSLAARTSDASTH